MQNGGVQGTTWVFGEGSPRPSQHPHRHDAFGAAPDALGDFGQGREEAENVVVVVAAVTEQQLVILVPSRADPTDVRIDLERSRRGWGEALPHGVVSSPAPWHGVLTNWLLLWLRRRRMVILVQGSGLCRSSSFPSR